MKIILLNLSIVHNQEYYGAYVCINEEVHKSFHHIYGYGDNTQEQWDSFVSQYKVA